MRQWSRLSKQYDVLEVRAALQGKGVEEVRALLPHAFSRKAAHATLRRLRDLRRLAAAVQGLPAAQAEEWAERGVREGLLGLIATLFQPGYTQAIGA
eukprot:gene9576-5511_t